MTMYGIFLGIPEVKYRLVQSSVETPPPCPAPIRMHGPVHGPREGGYT